MGTITNTSGESIDQVSVIVTIYNANSDVIYEETDGTVGLTEWSSWEFEIVAKGATYAEQYDHHDTEVIAEQQTA